MNRRHGLAVALVALLATPAAGNGLRGGGARGGGLGGGVGPAAGPAGGGLPQGADREARRERLDRVGPTTPSDVGRVPPPEVVQPEDPAPAAPTQRGPTTVVHARRGDVRFVADLARVDLTLAIRNVSPGTVEWSRSYRIDPAAEVVGAVLNRPGAEPITARTLSLVDARRIYEEARTPRRPRPSEQPNRDPLRVERLRRTELSVVVWPIAPGETVEVVLSFVTPLRGDGAERRFVDVLEGDPGAGERVRRRRSEDDPRVTPAENGVLASAEWSMHPGQLVLASMPTGLAFEGEKDGTLTFRSADDQPLGRHAEIAFRSPTVEAPFATVVPGGGLDRRIAMWRFDPASWLAARGFAVRPDLTLRLKPAVSGADRLAPTHFGATDLARPVTVRLRHDVDARFVYDVEVVDRTGTVIHTDRTELPLRRTTVDADLVAAIGSWHRALLAGRVYEAARLSGQPERMEEAVAFAVDQGVLLPGSAALALPSRERRGLTPASRLLYDRDGVPLGAPRREADLRPLPRHLLDK